jgi:putative heme-binding domain-containing protein
MLPNLELGLGERAEPTELTWDQLPSRLRTVLDVAWKNDTTDSVLLRIGLRFHSPAALKRTTELVTSTKTPVDVRQQAIRNLAELAKDAAIEPLLTVSQNLDEPEALRLAAIDASQRFRDDRIRDLWLALYPSSNEALQQRLAQGLLSRPEWAAAFLQEFLAGRLPVKQLKAEDWQNVIADMDDESRELVVKTWGSVAPPTAEERLAEIRRLNNDLRAGAGDSQNGKQLFGQHCAICHKLHGEGYNVGPDLTHANRKDRDYLLVQLVDPSAIIRKEYLTYSASTTDGRVLTGLLVNQNAAELTLMAAKEAKTTVPLSDVEELKESKSSLMPENVLKQLKPQELRDLFSFLQQSP